ncbi:MAG: hypothetical protein ABW199_09780, partial [Caulobacterales bacterium]
MSALRFVVAAAACATMAGATAAQAEPQIRALSDSDAQHYRSAFAAIESQDWATARQQLADVEDDVLVGAARGRMLVNRSYRPSYSELNNWLERYGDLGIAPAVYERAQDARPHRGRGRRRHAVGPAPVAPTPSAVRIPEGASRPPPGDTASARSQINTLSARVAAADYSGAKIAGEAALNGPRSGEAHWWLGLVAFRERDYADAANHFSQAAAWPYFSTWSRSAANYWAARSLLASGSSR